MTLPKQVLQPPVTYSQMNAHRIHQNNQNHYRGGLATTMNTQGNQTMKDTATTALNAEILASNKRGGSRSHKYKRVRRRNRKLTRKYKK